MMRAAAALVCCAATALAADPAPRALTVTGGKFVDGDGKAVVRPAILSALTPLLTLHILTAAAVLARRCTAGGRAHIIGH